jgi:PhnB protein
MHSNTYLFFDGNCAEAMRFYERTLGGKLEILTHAQSPMKDQPPSRDFGDRVMHARLVFDGGELMASDDMPGQYAGLHGFRVALHFDDIAQARRMFEALSPGGHVTLPLQETFWSEAFAMFEDRYGTPWMINGPAKAIGPR